MTSIMLISTFAGTLNVWGQGGVQAVSAALGFFVLSFLVWKDFAEWKTWNSHIFFIDIFDISVSQAMDLSLNLHSLALLL
jgi:hypothetical protein